ncbi:hypothetical protein [Acidisoma sp. S159]|uniref:hypothetical protein n=1 Tax=Acidisoma sp. S159 TaxID=1747225 RepID=UPI00131CC504|nr:hypothetical protein [Acidisoma sp. S159]
MGRAAAPGAAGLGGDPGRRSASRGAAGAADATTWALAAGVRTRGFGALAEGVGTTDDDCRDTAVTTGRDGTPRGGDACDGADAPLVAAAGGEGGAAGVARLGAAVAASCLAALGRDAIASTVIRTGRRGGGESPVTTAGPVARADEGSDVTARGATIEASRAASRGDARLATRATVARDT